MDAPVQNSVCLETCLVNSIPAFSFETWTFDRIPAHFFYPRASPDEYLQAGNHVRVGEKIPLSQSRTDLLRRWLKTTYRPEQ